MCLEALADERQAEEAAKWGKSVGHSWPHGRPPCGTPDDKHTGRKTVTHLIRPLIIILSCLLPGVCVLFQGKISREDVADLCVALLGLPSAVDTTFEIKSTIPFSQPWAPEEAAAPRDWAAELSGAGVKPGVTGKTVNGVYTGKEPEAVAAGAGAVAPGAAKR